MGRFVLLAMAQGGPVAITYAARHPERIAGLIFYGSYASPSRDETPDDVEMHEAFDRLIGVGWARPESEFRRVFTSMMIPGGTEEQRTWLDELQRVTVDTETAMRSRRQRKRADAIDLLPQLTAPTLVIHSLRDRMNDFGQARHLAANIDGARLTALDSDNHIVLEDEPAWPELAGDAPVRRGGARGRARRLGDRRPQRPTTESHPVRPRGRGAQAGQSRPGQRRHRRRAVTLSPRTVERHLQNVYVKLGVSGRSARTAAVARLLTGSV